MLYRHDKVRNRGFNVDPELLAHDLTILKLSKMKSITEKTHNVLLYEKYLEILNEFTILINHEIRRDSNHPDK